MLVNKAVQLCAVVFVVLWDSGAAFPTITQKLCGRKLSDFMSKVCDAYNSPSWDSVPIVVEQPGAVRKKREVDGIADQCCLRGCTFEELAEYCSSVITYTESPETPDMIETRTQKRSTELDHLLPMVVVEEGPSHGGHAGPGEGQAASQRENLLKKSVSRAPPVVGTVSPVLQWPRTINTDQPPAPPDHGVYYSAVYSLQPQRY